MQMSGKSLKKINEDSDTKPITMYAWSNFVKHLIKVREKQWCNLSFPCIWQRRFGKKVIFTLRIKNNKNPEIYGTGEELKIFM